MSGMNRSKRFIVRTTLITGSTLATIIGAQSLALLDQDQIADLTATPEPITVQAPAQEPTPSLNPTAESPTATAAQAAPNIAILRHPGQPTGQSAATTANQPVNTAIQPPNPVQIAPPDPVIVQNTAPQSAAPAPRQQAPQPRTRSS